MTLRHCADDSFDVLAEPVRLEQVFVNLLTNSMDAMADRSRRAIAVAIGRRERLVEIRVTDSGTGIGAGERDRIFDPFFTTKSPGAGLGLGLSISFNIARDFGGRLVLEGSSPQGSTFLLELRESPGA